MTQLTDYISAPYQGVSQAAPQVRDKAQAEILDNISVGIPQGAIKRPPFSYQAMLRNHPGHTDGVFERVDREGTGDVILTITNEAGVVTPRIYNMASMPANYDVNGLASQPITISAEAQAYLNTGNPVPNRDLRILTVEDYTFITNKLATVGTVVGAAPTRPFEGILWVRQSAYARTYKVTIDPVGAGAPVTVELLTPNGATTASAEFVDTDVIAAALYSGVYTAVDGATISATELDDLLAQGFTINQIGGVLYVYHPTIDFTMTVEDGQGGTALLAIKDRVQRFSDLPAKAVDGFTVRIEQQSGSDADDFFVTFAETAGTGTGIWKETIAPGAPLGLDPETMPVALVFDSGWEIDIADWKPRTTGDAVLSPDPDFVGGSVQDLTFYRGRLGVVSGEGSTLSASDDPFRLYPETLSSVIATDPLGYVSPFPGKNTLRFATPFDKRLILFGDAAQCEIAGDADGEKIDVITTYEFSNLLRPQPNNGNLYFTAPRGKTSSVIYEMEVDRVTAVTEAEDLTTAVPSYLPPGIDRAANCPIQYTVVYGRSGDNDFFPHLFRYVESQRVQNAFTRWTFPEGFLNGGMFFRNAELWAVACKDGAAHCVMADTSPELRDDHPDARILTHLDFRMTEDQVVLAYSALTDRTIVTLPFDRIDTVKVTSRAPGGNAGPSLSEDGPPFAPEGFSADVLLEESEDEADNEVVLNGDWTDCPLWVGVQYTAFHRLSRIYAFAPDGTPLRAGKLGLGRLIVDYANTGYLRAEVKVGGRATRRYTFMGYRWDDPESIYNRSPNDTFKFSFPVRGNNERTTIDLINDSHFASSVLGFEWRGELSLKAQRAS